MWLKNKPAKITFRCASEDLGVIAEPVAAKKHMPDWFKSLPAVDKDHLTASDNGLTVKRCMPFVDAMSAGWILPLAADVRLEITDAGRTVKAGWEFDKVMISSHNSHQIAGHPQSSLPPNKFHNYWSISTPAGWSCLFLPLLNHNQPLFKVFAGVVDTDTYQALIHFPFLATGGDGIHLLKKGTPLVQVIPFRRDSTYIEAEIRAESQAEGQLRESQRRNTQSTDGWYREHARSQR